MLYAFFWVIPRRLNSDTGEIIQKKAHYSTLTITPPSNDTRVHITNGIVQSLTQVKVM